MENPPISKSAAEVLFGGSSPQQSASSQSNAAGPSPALSNGSSASTQSDVKASPVQDAATALFGDLPADGVRYDEPEPNSIAELAIEAPADMVVTDAEEMEQVKEAMVATGIGVTLKNALVEMAVPILRTGEPIETTEAECMQRLREKFGSRAESKIQAARAMVAEGAKKWPGVVDFLVDSGLGNSPDLIEKLAARSSRRPRRR